jgi:hypothetical protein
MARIPLVESKESLAPEHQKVYDAIVKSRSEVRGCFPALLHVPTIADHTASLGATCASTANSNRRCAPSRR